LHREHQPRIPGCLDFNFTGQVPRRAQHKRVRLRAARQAHRKRLPDPVDHDDQVPRRVRNIDRDGFFRRSRNVWL
jgi:hypothetical protein